MLIIYINLTFIHLHIFLLILSNKFENINIRFHFYQRLQLKNLDRLED